MNTEKYLSALELSSELARLGLRPCGYREAMRIIKTCDESIGFSVKLSDALTLLKAETRHRWPRPNAECNRGPLTVL